MSATEVDGPSKRPSRREMALNRVADDSAIKRPSRPESRDEPFKRKSGRSGTSSSLRSGKELQEALLQSDSSLLSLESFMDEDFTPKIPKETELANLEPFQPTDCKEHLTFYADTSSHAAVYRQIFLQARRLNYNISDLEVVFVGLRNQGKSSLLQAMLGVPLPLGRTRRAFHYHLVNDPAVSSPRYIIKEQSKEQECTLEQLQKELVKRNRARTEPVTLLIEYKWGFDMTIIDTPAIKSLNEMANWARPAMTGVSNRFLVAVESAKPTKNLQVFHWLKHFDPSFSRSMLVLTGFDNFLSGFRSRPRSALFHFEELENVPCFWTTLPSEQISQDCALDSNLFKLRVWQYYKRDLDSLRVLDLDYSRNQRQIGIYSFRKSFDHIFQTDIHRHIPSLSRLYERTLMQHEKQALEAQENCNNWQTDNIRSYASEYTTHWLRNLEDLIRGSSIGEPSKNGQTLAQEQAEFARWDSRFASLIDFSYVPFGGSSDTLSGQITTSSVKLYGAPQLLRLLEEFRIAASQLQTPEIEHTEVLPTVDSAWAASEIARRMIEQQFLPLLDQLVSRAFYIMKRVSVVNDLVMEKRVASLRKRLQITQKSFPAFSTFLRQSYSASQSSAQSQCISKCKEEFCSSLTIYWELTSGIDPLDASKDPQSRKQQVEKAAKNIYSKIKERLVEAFVLNVQSCFLSASSTLAFMKRVAADVSTLSEGAIKDMFLIDQIKASYQNEVKAHKQELTELKSLQEIFLGQLIPQIDAKK